MYTAATRNPLKRLSSEIFILFIVMALVSSGLGISRAHAAAVEVGYKDFAFGSAYSPTGEKPQSKLWFNDGLWWGVLYNKASSSKHYEIYRFNWAADTWTTTGVMVDARTKSSPDVLWTGSKLYTVSNLPPDASGDANVYLTRYSYNAASKTYSPDSGFPVAVYNRKVEAAVLDQDSTGKLWVTFTDANSSGGRNAYVTHSTVNDTTWTTPYVVPVAGASTLKSDDISTLVAYNGRIGVMWSNQTDSTVYFAYHPDGTADSNWISNPAVQSPKYADDHLNIKSLQADSAGQLFAVVKTSLNDVEPSTSSKPLVLLLQLDNQGSWSRRTVWRVSDNVTRPIVLLDQQNRTIYAFATLNYGSQDSGAIYYKSVGMDSPGLQFTEGPGTPFIVSSSDTHINNASSTKQTLNSTTNLLVIAGDDTSNYYFHNKLVLGSGSVTPTATHTTAPTNTPTHTPAATGTGTPIPTFTSTAIPTATSTGTSAPAFTPTDTSTPGSTPTATVTPAPAFTATATFTASPPPGGPDFLFADGFESGDLSAWTSAAIGGGDLSVSPAAALAGSQGLQVLLNDGTLLYALDETPSTEPRYRVRFYFDPNSLSMGSGDSFNLLRAFAGSSKNVLQIAFRYSSGSYQLRVAVLNDSSSFVTTSWTTISDAPHWIELDWRAATGPGANNGSLAWWVDGVEQGSVSGLDNDTWRIDQVRLGALSSIPNNTRGTFFLDAFESRRETYIGP